MAGIIDLGADITMDDGASDPLNQMIGSVEAAGTSFTNMAGQAVAAGSQIDQTVQSTQRAAEEMSGDVRESVEGVVTGLDTIYGKLSKEPAIPGVGKVEKSFQGLGKAVGTFAKAVEFSFERVSGNLIDLQTTFDLDKFKEDASDVDAFTQSFREMTTSLRAEVDELIEQGHEPAKVFRGAMEVMGRYQRATKALAKENTAFAAVYKEDVLPQFHSFGVRVARAGYSYADMTGVVEASRRTWKATGEAWNAVIDSAQKFSDSMRADEKLVKIMTQDYFDLRQELERLAVVYGQSDDQLEAAVSNTFRLSAATGVATEKILGVATALAATGVRLEDDAIKSTAERLTLLAGTYGMTGEALAEFQSTAVFAAESMEDGSHSMNRFINSATEMTQKFGVPGLLSQLGEVSRAVEDDINRLGEEIVGSGADAQHAIQKNAAIIAKSFNVDIVNALGKAKEIFTEFNDELSAIEDVNLGLADSFGGLTQAILENAGGAFASMQDVADFMKMGRESPVEFAKSVREIAAGFGEGSMQARRFIKEVSKNVPEAVRDLIQNELAMKGTLTTLQQIEEAGAKNAASFEDFTKAYRDTFKEMQGIFDALIGIGKQVIGDLFAKDFKDAFEPATGILKSVNLALVDFVESMKQSDSFYNKYLRPVIVGGAKLTMGLAAAAGALAAAMTGVTTAFAGFAGVSFIGKAFGFLRGKTASLAGSMASIGQSIEPVTKGIGTLARGMSKSGYIGKAFGWITKALGRSVGGFGSLFQTFKIFGTKVPGLNVAIGVISGLMTAYDQMKDAFSDPSAEGVDRFVAIVKGALYGLLDFVDSAFFFGIGSLIKDFFFEDLGNSIDGWITSALSNISLEDALLFAIGLVNPVAMALAIVNVFFPLENIFNTLGIAMQDAGRWMANEMPKYVTAAFEEMGFVVGATLRYVLYQMWIDGAKFVMGGLSDMFNPNKSGQGLLMSAANLMAGLGHAILGALEGVISSIWGAVKGLTIGIVAGVLGETTDTINDSLMIAWIKAKAFVDRAMAYSTAFVKLRAAQAKMTFADQNDADALMKIGKEIADASAVLDDKLAKQRVDRQIESALKEVNLKRETARKTRRIAQDAQKAMDADQKKSNDKSIRAALRSSAVYQDAALAGQRAVDEAKRKAKSATGATQESIAAAVRSEQTKQVQILQQLEGALRKGFDEAQLKNLAVRLSGDVDVKGATPKEIAPPAPPPSKVKPQRAAGSPPAATQPVKPPAATAAAAKPKREVTLEAIMGRLATSIERIDRGFAKGSKVELTVKLDKGLVEKEFRKRSNKVRARTT